MRHNWRNAARRLHSRDECELRASSPLMSEEDLAWGLVMLVQFCATEEAFTYTPTLVHLELYHSLLAIFVQYRKHTTRSRHFGMPI